MSKKKKKIPNEQGETQIQIQRLIGRIYTNALSIPAVQSAIKDKDEGFFFQTNNNAKREMQSLTKRMSKQLDALLLNAIKGEWEQGYLDFENDLKRLDDSTAQALRLRQAFRDEATQSARLAGARAFFAQQRGGLTISQRVWNLANNAQKELEIVIQNGIKQGKSPGEVAKSLKEYLNKPEALFRGVKNKDTGKTELSKAARKYKPGQGVYRSAYKNALRLARTEMKQAYHSAQWQAGQANPLVVGWRISLSNNHTTLKNGKPTPFRDMCDDLVGEYPKDFKFTGWHPQCRCVMTPILASPAECKSLYRSIFENGTNTPQPRPLPNNFKQWLQNNKRRIERAKTTPLFLQQNKNVIQKNNQHAKGDRGVTTNAKSILQRAKQRQQSRTQEQIQAIQDKWNRRQEQIKQVKEIESLFIESKVSYRQVFQHTSPQSKEQIINRLAGGDLTKGSCSSLAFAYAGNRLGLDVLDFRGGESCDLFARDSIIKSIFKLVGGTIERHTNDYIASRTLLRTLEIGKEYYFATGRHAAIVRRTEKCCEYLELQSNKPSENGFQPFKKNTLKERFKAQKSHTSYGMKLHPPSFLADVELFRGNLGFKKILGYLNTAEDKQKKGEKGKIK